MQGIAPFVLRWTGAATLLAGVLFVLPVAGLRLLGVEAPDDASLLFVRHWGLLVFCVGALLMHAAGDVAGRRAIIFAAAVAKAGLVMLLVLNWRLPELRGLHAVALFDAACVALYLVILWPGGRKQVSGAR